MMRFIRMKLIRALYDAYVEKYVLHFKLIDANKRIKELEGALNDRKPT